MSSRHSGMTKVLRQNHTDSDRWKVRMRPESSCRTIAGRADHVLARESLRRFRTSAFCHEILHPITLVQAALLAFIAAEYSKPGTVPASRPTTFRRLGPNMFNP